jgi:Dihydrouridine synthase (Dus)
MQRNVQVERMVTGIAAGLRVPLTAKIRIFPELDRTLAYARMLERCGVQLLAVHGRTREQKDARAHRADWDAIKVGPPESRRCKDPRPQRRHRDEGRMHADAEDGSQPSV